MYFTLAEKGMGQIFVWESSRFVLSTLHFCLFVCLFVFGDFALLSYVSKSRRSRSLRVVSVCLFHSLALRPEVSLAAEAGFIVAVTVTDSIYAAPSLSLTIWGLVGVT